MERSMLEKDGLKEIEKDEKDKERNREKEKMVQTDKVSFRLPYEKKNHQMMLFFINSINIDPLILRTIS